eukprot:3838216-Amphidinium_carterae.1
MQLPLHALPQSHWLLSSGSVDVPMFIKMLKLLCVNLHYVDFLLSSTPRSLQPGEGVVLKRSGVQGHSGQRRHNATRLYCRKLCQPSLF